MKRTTQPYPLILLLLFLAGCGQTAEEQLAQQATMIAYTQTAQAPTPMPAVLEFAVAVEQAKSTMAAVEATQVWIYGQMTATQVAKEEMGTQQAAGVTAQAFAVQSTATHEAFVANQAATQQSFMVTSTAQAIGTATAFPQTATAQSLHQTQTQQAWQTTATMDAAYGAAQATSAAGNAESVVLSVERDRLTNKTRAWAPWLAFVALIGLIIVMGIRYSKVRVIQKDAFGTSPLLVVDGTAMDVDSSTSMRMLPDGSTEWKQGDSEVNERKQKVDLVRAMPAGKPEISPIFMDGPRKQPTIEVLEAGTMPRALLDEIEDSIIEEE